MTGRGISMLPEEVLQSLLLRVEFEDRQAAETLQTLQKLQVNEIFANLQGQDRPVSVQEMGSSASSAKLCMGLPYYRLQAGAQFQRSVFSSIMGGAAMLINHSIPVLDRHRYR